MTKWVVFLIIVLVFLILYQNYSYVQEILGLNKETEVEDTNSEILYENDYTSETPEDTADESELTSGEAETSEEEVSAPVAFDKTTLSISVLNGNGISGSAKAVKSALESAGFSVSHVGNALKFSYINTNIYYNIGKSSEAESLKSVLTDRTCDIFENSSITGNYDIVVVVGAN